MSLPEGIKLRDEAMALVNVPEWTAKVVEYIRGLNGGTEFSGDDVWENVVRPTGLEPRALGPAIRESADAGLCVKVPGRYTPTARKEAHARPIQIWMRTH